MIHICVKEVDSLRFLSRDYLYFELGVDVFLGKVVVEFSAHSVSRHKGRDVTHHRILAKTNEYVAIVALEDSESQRSHFGRLYQAEGRLQEGANQQHFRSIRSAISAATLVNSRSMMFVALDALALPRMWCIRCSEGRRLMQRRASGLCSAGRRAYPASLAASLLELLTWGIGWMMIL
jgi:hypothetical protein